MKNRLFYDRESESVVIETQGKCFEIPASPDAADMLQNPSVIAFLKMIQIGK
jgi:hypothetical protein